MGSLTAFGIEKEEIKKEIKKSQSFMIGKKLLKVKAYELEQAIKELRYGLILNKKSMDQFENESMVKNEYSIEEIMEIFKGFPCDVKDETEVQKLVRYLVEDNNQEYVEYDPKKKQDKICILAILRKLLGKYSVWEDKKEFDIAKNTCSQIGKFQASVLDMLEQGGPKKGFEKGWFNIDMLLESLAYFGLGLSEEEVMYVEMEFYRETKQLKQFNIQLLVDLFDWDSLLRRNQVFKRIQERLENEVVEKEREQQIKNGGEKRRKEIELEQKKKAEEEKEKQRLKEAKEEQEREIERQRIAIREEEERRLKEEQRLKETEEMQKREKEEKVQTENQQKAIQQLQPLLEQIVNMKENIQEEQKIQEDEMKEEEENLYNDQQLEDKDMLNLQTKVKYADMNQKTMQGSIEKETSPTLPVFLEKVEGNQQLDNSIEEQQQQLLDEMEGSQQYESEQQEMEHQESQEEVPQYSQEEDYEEDQYDEEEQELQDQEQEVQEIKESNDGQNNTNNIQD